MHPFQGQYNSISPPPSLAPWHFSQPAQLLLKSYTYPCWSFLLPVHTCHGCTHYCSQTLTESSSCFAAWVVAHSFGSSIYATVSVPVAREAPGYRGHSFLLGRYHDWNSVTGSHADPTKCSPAVPRSLSAPWTAFCTCTGAPLLLALPRTCKLFSW